MLDTWYPELGLGEMPTSATMHGDLPQPRRDDVRGVDVRAVELSIDLDAAPASAGDVYLRLHLLSNRLCAPRTINLDGLFGLLVNVAWTNLGPVAVDQVDEVRWTVRRAGADPHGPRPRQVPADDRLRRAHAVCASPTPTGCASAPTSRRAPP